MILANGGERHPALCDVGAREAQLDHAILGRSTMASRRWHNVFPSVPGSLSYSCFQRSC
jgi:hypothetical protein